ncbi:MAG: hypothetical protein FJ294_12795 [Planctomycetes bacterium]|nr:hypothetical protein [Planctomycetota bacterium]
MSESPNGRPSDDGAARALLARPKVADVLGSVGERELGELYLFWGGADSPPPSSDLAERRKILALWMGDGEIAEARMQSLGRRPQQVLAMLLDAQGYMHTTAELADHRLLAHLSRYELESCVQALVRCGALLEVPDRRSRFSGGKTWAVPMELGDGLLRQQRAKRRGVFDLLTLRGFLDRQYDDPVRGKRITPTRLREMYKMYSNETAALARVERLPDESRPLIEKCILQFGGLLPRGLFERLEDGSGPWNGGRWKQVLEENLVGTVEKLELSRYGIAHADDTLVVFNEIALAWLRRVAVPGDPDAPHSEHGLGVDLVSNISRFMGFLIEHNVRFTVRGEIFKTTEKRILQDLIPNPGRELSRAAVLDFIFEFTRGMGLIESTGERTFAIAGAGRDWEQRPLEHKLHVLVEYATEERDVAGDWYHQVRLRRIFMRLMKRMEPGTWYDLMYLPFLSRNTYLAGLDQLAVDEYFATRSQGASCAPMEDPQRLAWNLARWVRQRLYLFGVVDLGYDRSGRPVAMKLTRSGARLLGVVEQDSGSAPLLGSLIVTPDFEVVLFPTGDDAALVHELDRFCERERQGETMHFRIHERSVQRALSEGMLLSRMRSVLRLQSRTPVPQNVLFSIRDWAGRAGVLHLDATLVLRGEDPDTLKRFQNDAGVRNFVREVLDERRLQLKSRYAPKRLHALLREFGYKVELDGVL